MRFALLIHDLIPIRRPEWCDRGVIISFIAWHRGVLPLADQIFANSRATAGDVTRWAREIGLDLPRPVRAVPMGTGLGVAALPAAQARGIQTGGVQAEATPAGSVAPEIGIGPSDLPEPGSYVLFVSTLEARKNHALLFRVWRRLLGEMPREQVPTLVFAGRVGWLVADLMQQLENAEWLGGKIRLIRDPSDEELLALYRGCRFTLYPSFYEGWGLPVSESLALGRPCIASDRTRGWRPGASASPASSATSPGPTAPTPSVTPWTVWKPRRKALERRPHDGIAGPHRAPPRLAGPGLAAAGRPAARGPVSLALRRRPRRAGGFDAVPRRMVGLVGPGPLPAQCHRPRAGEFRPGAALVSVGLRRGGGALRVAEPGPRLPRRGPALAARLLRRLPGLRPALGHLPRLGQPDLRRQRGQQSATLRPMGAALEHQPGGRAALAPAGHDRRPFRLRRPGTAAPAPDRLLGCRHSPVPPDRGVAFHPLPAGGGAARPPRLQPPLRQPLRQPLLGGTRPRPAAAGAGWVAGSGALCAAASPHLWPRAQRLHAALARAGLHRPGPGLEGLYPPGRSTPLVRRG
ncbi:MAG: hypothetical protein DI532_09805 [Azospirillum brasilense]|nr:MAG: hypothetical protein DI532_09805 [Azospirillum brasilense]